MAAPRVDIDAEKQALKAACKALVKDAGGVECGLTRVGKSSLGEYGAPDNENFMPADVIADLEAVTHGRVGHPRVTRFLAQRAGYLLLKAPSADVPSEASLLAAIADQARAANAVTAGMIEALDDRIVTAAEARREMENCYRAAESVMRLHALLSRISEEG